MKVFFISVAKNIQCSSYCGTSEMLALTTKVLWLSKPARCAGQYWSEWAIQQSQAQALFLHTVRFIRLPFFSLSSLFCRAFIFLRWLVQRDDSLWHLSQKDFFFCETVSSSSLELTFSLCRASVLWLLPSCISSSWRPSAGCWQRRGSPTWLSLAKWDHDSFESGFCASAGVSEHIIVLYHTHMAAV